MTELVDEKYSCPCCRNRETYFLEWIDDIDPADFESFEVAEILECLKCKTRYNPEKVWNNR